MFARWRNLAAAAGALCFPFAIVQASPQRDDFSQTGTAACIRFQEPNDESSWFRTERDSWYQQYYDDGLDDDASVNDEPFTNAPKLLPPACQQDAVISNIESIDEPSDELAPENSTIDLGSEFFDVYAPYEDPDVTSRESSKSVPTAKLTGTIEPIFEDAEAAWSDKWFCGDAPSHRESVLLLEEINPISNPNDADDEEFNECDEIDEGIDSNNSNDDAPQYHFFYPGCDWSPYYPASTSESLLPEDVRSA
jgi:hypothetical protein